MIKKFESFVNEDLHNTNRKVSGKTPIFTLNALDITTDEGIEDMKYIGQTYYSEDDAIDAAREMANAYSDLDGVIIVSVMAGEYEMPSGDIYGEPMDIYTISNKDKNQTIQAREESGYVNAEVDEYIIEMNNKKYFDTLNESFTNQELKDAIKAHGGLIVNKCINHDARTSLVDFDLKNAKFVGYLKPETVDDIYNNNCFILLYKSRDIILRTNDGGIIVVEKDDSVLDKNYYAWLRKVKTRNNNWIEDIVRKYPEKKYWNTAKRDIEYDSIEPDKDATHMRRSKHINRK